MKAQKIVANATAKVAKVMAMKACGAASMWGAYQPKEPKALKNLKK
ncbi:MAG: cyclic lactone autoinducer peptide [Oscillospiraceae bacterium]|nr:cyclic lactone autoinducer peptide [Oscillospiraceae bacterium]